ncbi:MAG: sugar phosphate isomerase/epimerase [Acidobacteriota bacterium]|nr:sugar phosphate isomerase/epimerase [Acidobacteriota bacterium]
MITRRQMIAAAVAAPAVISRHAKAQTQGRPRLGGAPTAFSLRMRAARAAGQQFDLVEHCHELGLGGVETFLPKDAGAVKNLRQKAEAYNMLLVLNAPLPKSSSDVAAFDASVRACKECGAMAMHAAMTGRRYEDFDSLEAFKQKFEQAQQSVALAEPVLRKYRMKLAIENHKGWRAAEQAAWMKRVGSEWVGVAYDLGNNISLCETPDETFRLLSPYAVFCHIKDMGVENYADGFLLSEVVFGQGVIDLKKTVDDLRAKDSNMLFCLEMITRDPLKIPVFTDKYWATFDDSYSPMPARDLAKTLELVRQNPPKTPLPKIAGLNSAEQVKAEDEYNLRCIAYAREHLGL